MPHVFISRLGVLVLTLAMGSGSMTPMVRAQTAAVQGVWRNADTTMRVTVTGPEARGQFVEIGQAARALGFNPGEVSFVATVNGNYLNGEQTIRYGRTCHPDGRKVPMIGRVASDGRVLALHYYNAQVDANCQDTGLPIVTETLWQRAPEQ